MVTCRASAETSTAIMAPGGAAGRPRPKATASRPSGEVVDSSSRSQRASPATVTWSAGRPPEGTGVTLGTAAKSG